MGGQGLGLAFSLRAALDGCELPGIGWVDADTVETLLGAVPLEVGRALLDARTGALLETTSSVYRPSKDVRTFVATRDGTCRMWGCDRPAISCDLDHARPWPTGPTSPRNLAGLCRRHHRLKQRRRWTYRLHPDGTVSWTSPSGRRRTTLPDHATWPPPDPSDPSDPAAPTARAPSARRESALAGPPLLGPDELSRNALCGRGYWSVSPGPVVPPLRHENLLPPADSPPQPPPERHVRRPRALALGVPVRRRGPRRQRLDRLALDGHRRPRPPGRDPRRVQAASDMTARPAAAPTPPDRPGGAIIGHRRRDRSCWSCRRRLRPRARFLR